MTTHHAAHTPRPPITATVAVDFDGVICVPYGGAPIPGALQFLAELHERGFTVAVHTCTKIERAERWLRRYGVEGYVDFVVNIKPPAVLYIDDRGWRFNGSSGDFTAILASLDTNTIQTWWEYEGLKPEWKRIDVADAVNGMDAIEKQEKEG